MNRSRAERDRQFQIECLTQFLVEMLMDDYGLTMERALDTVYDSQTYKKIENPATGLYFQGAVYVMDMLQNELAQA